MNRPALALVIVFVLGACVIGVLGVRGSGAAAFSRGAAPDTWQLAPVPAAPSAADLALVSTPESWGLASAAAAADAKPLTPPDWRIVGVYRRGNRGHIVLRFAGSPTAQLLSVGDTLPGGSRILSIEDDFLAIRINGKRRVLRITGS